MSEMPYTFIPDYPKDITSGSVLARLVDGVAFRYRWSTEDLRDVDFDFCPCEGSMDFREVLQHILRICLWMETIMPGREATRNEKPSEINDGEKLRKLTLESLTRLRESYTSMSDDELKGIIFPRGEGVVLPFWHLINGPLADVLTHVGQINSWRRINGNPTPRANVFAGQPPEEN